MWFFSTYFLLWCTSTLVFGSVDKNSKICRICLCGNISYLMHQGFAVNCSYTGITEANVTLLQNLPEETEILIFNGNNVPILPINIFGEKNAYKNLKIVDMIDNKIEEIKGKTFHRVPFVEILLLDHNSITLSKFHSRMFSSLENLRELHLTDAFLDYKSADLAEQLHTIFNGSNLTKLQKLHLEQNEIQSFVNRNVFCDLINLTDLYLGNNKLKGLDFNIKCLPNLWYVDLEGNEIERFSREDLSAFDSFPARNRTFCIDIHKNPFLCDCIVNNLYWWLKTTEVKVRNNDTIQCHFLRNTEESIFLNNFHVSDCTRTENSYNAISDDNIHQLIHYLFLSTVLILVILLIYVSIRFSMEYCGNTVTPTSKVHYVVIRNPEDNREGHV